MTLIHELTTSIQVIQVLESCLL